MSYGLFWSFQFPSAPLRERARKRTYFIHEKHEKHEPYTGHFCVFRVVRGQVSTRISKLELGTPRKDLTGFACPERGTLS